MIAKGTVEFNMCYMMKRFIKWGFILFFDSQCRLYLDVYIQIGTKDFAQIYLRCSRKHFRNETENN